MKKVLYLLLITQAMLLASRDIATLQELCTRNITKYCNRLGHRYQSGQGVARNPSKALKLYQKSCDLKSYNGCFLVGSFYNSAKGIKKNRQKAKHFYEKSCNLGGSNGCYSLGLVYEREGDFINALRWDKKACTLKNKDACWRVADLYYHGKSGYSDMGEAKQYAQQACSYGSQAACEIMGEIYEKGKTVKADIGKAKTYYHKACGKYIKRESACSSYERLNHR